MSPNRSLFEHKPPWSELKSSNTLSQVLLESVLSYLDRSLLPLSSLVDCPSPPVHRPLFCSYREETQLALITFDHNLGTVCVERLNVPRGRNNQLGGNVDLEGR
ncbi:hypothetical protein CDL15_Pgr019996 [Punica granatum]|uniref:Uncharacterized protein n=1 Tax=Punica granatum TaxID=22663 RepID=A0A218VS23_PUNGR|nr:hypothetical protein CDL15_Pgr019996 [Punica granatum]